MCRWCSDDARESLEISVSICEPEQTEAEATSDLLRVGARMALVVVGFFALATLGCVSCMAFGPDRAGSQHAPLPLHPPPR
jgi:hypothetical protein